MVDNDLMGTHGESKTAIAGDAARRAAVVNPRAELDSGENRLKKFEFMCWVKTLSEFRDVFRVRRF